MVYAAILALVLSMLCYVRHRLRQGRLTQYNLDMRPPDPDAIEYELGFVCIYYGHGRGGVSTVLLHHANTP